MSKKLKQGTHHYAIWAIFYGLGIVLFSACNSSRAGTVSTTQLDQPPTINVATPLTITNTQTDSVPTTTPTDQPAVEPSPTQTQTSTSCTGYKYNYVCIIDPQHLLTGQPVDPNAITPMLNDMVMTVTTGTVTVSQKYGILNLTISDESGSGDDRDYCKQVIFLAFSVTESDYVFPVTSITCQVGIVTLTATLTMQTAKEIDWNTQLTVAEESSIAWNQYDTHYESQ